MKIPRLVLGHKIKKYRVVICIYVYVDCIYVYVNCQPMHFGNLIHSLFRSLSSKQ